MSQRVRTWVCSFASICARCGRVQVHARPACQRNRGGRGGRPRVSWTPRCPWRRGSPRLQSSSCSPDCHQQTKMCNWRSPDQCFGHTLHYQLTSLACYVMHHWRTQAIVRAGLFDGCKFMSLCLSVSRCVLCLGPFDACPHVCQGRARNGTVVRY